MNYLSKENVQEVLGLSLLQERMVQPDRPLEEGGDLVQVVLTLQGVVEPHDFQTAWERVIQLHPGLRSVFRPVKNRTVQVVLKKRPIEVEVQDLRSLQPLDLQDAVTEGCERHWQPISISEGPLMRLALLLVNEESSILIWTYHALLLDDPSRERVLSDVQAEYQALVAGGGWAKEPDASFKGYLQWLTTQDWTPAQSFWKKQLAGFQAPTPYLEGARPQQATARWERRTLKLSPALTAALEEMASQSQVSWQAIPHAMWAILLQIYSGEDDIAFGSWTSGRSCVPKESSEVVRSLANLVPLRLQADGEASLPAFLKQVDEQLQQMEKFGFLPLSSIRRDSGVAEDIPLYTSTLLVSESRVPLATVWNVQQEELRREQDGSLRLHLKRGAVWELQLEYASQLVPAETVDRMQAHWQALLESMVQQPNAQLCQLNVLPEQERQTLFVAHNQTLLPAPNLDRLAHHVIEAQVATRPEDIAASCGDERVTYRELNERANRLAHWLRDQGFGRDDLAGLLAERSIEMLVAILAVFKAGGAYVPLDSAHPDARIGTVLANSQVKVILTQKELAARSQSLAKELNVEPLVFCLNEHGDESDVPDVRVLSGYSPENPVPVNEPQDLANVFYTSGSTGLPKGAMVEHIGMLNHLWAKINLLDLKEDCVVAQNASHCFDISVWQFIAPLMVGGQVVIYPTDIASDPRALFEAVRQDGVTALEMVPAVIELFLQAAAEQEPGHRDLPRLRYMMSTGEGLAVSLCRKWLQDYPEIKVVNAYGATETSDDFAHATIDGDSNLEGLTHVHLGTTIPNFNLYLLDSWHRPVPIGVVGEVCTTGIGVGRGYLNDPERTAKAFVANPFADGMGERMYKTGDLARYRIDGRLAFVQRKDFQVKVRGHRIELGEIEAGLLRHPSVSQCVAVVTPDADGQNRILAYLVLGEPVDQDELRRFLAESVPDYMIPAHLIVLPELPLNANGKVDRNLLPSPEETEKQARTIVPPRNEEEAELAKIWEDVLGIAPIGIEDNFFTLGGHSLRTIQVRSRIKSRFGVDVPLTDLFEQQTIRDLMPLIESAAATGKESGSIEAKITRISEDGVVLIQQGEAAHPPLFLIHDQGGGIMPYFHLVKELGPEQTVYGVQAIGYATDQAPLRTMQEMVERYYAEIKHVAPDGPYRLGGWSLGGSVAFELALRFEASGDEVEFVGLFDTQPMGQATEHPVQSWTDRDLLMENAKLLALQESDVQDLDNEQLLDLLLARVGEQLNWFDGADRTDIWKKVRLMATSGRILNQYQYRHPLLTDLHLFLVTSESKVGHRVVDANEWVHRTNGESHVYHVSGDHLTMFDPEHIPQLVEQIKNAFQSIARKSEAQQAVIE